MFTIAWDSTPWQTLCQQIPQSLPPRTTEVSSVVRELFSVFNSTLFVSICTWSAFTSLVWDSFSNWRDWVSFAKRVHEHGWLKIKNPHYTQTEGRHEMFEAFRQR